MAPGSGNGAKGKGERGKGERGKSEGSNKDVDSLFQIPLDEFTAARNALAAGLKSDGDAESAERVKTLTKPSISAWVANQLYWRHRKAFDRLLAAGDRFRAAQAAQLAGKSADLRAPLDERRKALGELTTLAGEILRDSGHPAAPDTMRRIMTTLEALATYGEHPEAPPAGRLTSDIDPPGFETLAALVPGSAKAPAGKRAGAAHAPSRVIPFSQPRREAAKRKGVDAKEEARRLEEERRAQRAEARKRLQEAEHALADAKRAAERARKAMKDAAARARAAEKAKAALESRFERLSAASDAARQDARRVASEAEQATQALDDAERAVRSAREKLKD